jgi:hypothetical protein
MAGSTDASQVRGEDVDQVRRHLHLTDPCLGLRVRDAEPSAVRIVEPDVAQAYVAQLAHAHPAAREHLDDRPPPEVRAGVGGTEVAQVMRDGRLGEAKLGGDRARPLAGHREARDLVPRPTRRPDRDGQASGYAVDWAGVRR